jgi:hypothetical protein
MNHCVCPDWDESSETIEPYSTLQGSDDGAWLNKSVFFLWDFMELKIMITDKVQKKKRVSLSLQTYVHKTAMSNKNFELRLSFA